MRDRSVELEVMRSIVGHAKQMRAKSLFDKYKVKPEVAPVQETKAEKEQLPSLSVDQIQQVVKSIGG